MDLEPEQFSVALLQAYENLVRIEHADSMSIRDRDGHLSEINKVIEAAQKKYPGTVPASRGSYFKQPRVQIAEAKLFPLLQADLKENKNVLVKDKVEKYNSWRDNKASKQGVLVEEPFNNHGEYSSRGCGEVQGKLIATPLQVAQGIMSKKQMDAEIAKIKQLHIR